MSIIHRLASAAQTVVGRVTRWQTGHPWLALALGLASTAMFTLAASRLEIRTNIEDLFPENTPHVLLAEKVRATLPASSQILLVVSSPDKAANERFADALCAKVAGDPDVSRVECRRDITFFKKNALLFLPPDELLSLEQKLKRAIKKAVARDMGPFGEEEDADGDAGGPGAGGPEEDEDEGFDDGFDDPPEGGKKDAGGDVGKKDAGADAGGPDGDDDELVVPDENEVRRKYNIASLSEFLSNADGTMIGLKVFPSFSPSEVNHSRDLIRRVEGMVASLAPESFHPELEWTMEGDYHKKIEEIAVIQRDLSKSSLFAIAVILVLVVAYFGRVRATIFVMVPLMSGMAWTMGLAWLTVGYLNLITAFIFAIMFGLGVDFAIHSTNRYMEERERGHGVAESLERGLVHLGRPMMSAALTTTITFLSLVIFKFRGFSQFGIIAGLGVPVCLLVVYLTLPPLVVLADRIVREKPMRKRFTGGGRTHIFGTWRRSMLVVGPVLAAVVVLAPGIARVEFEADMGKVMAGQGESRRSSLMKRFRREVESRSTSPVVALTGSLEETRKVHEYLSGQRSRLMMLQDFASIFSFVPDDQAGRAEIIERMRQEVTRKRNALTGKDLENADKALAYLSPSPFGVEQLPDWVKDRFTDREGHIGRFVLLFAHGHKAHADDVNRILKELDQIKVDGKTYSTTASYYILKDAYDIVLKEGPVAVGLAALAVLLIVIIDFRRRREVVASFLPLMLGVAAYLGFMGYAGENLNMFNMVVLPTMFGIGIDTSIHLVHRIREEGVDRMEQIVSSTGAASGMSAATTAIGFGSMVLATNPGLRSIGELAPVGILSCYLTSVLLTPSLMFLWNGRKKIGG